ncbi:S4 domain-containing protein [uncultured Parabacteroides sp.]|uniref:S4 domain-containing protein n=1 Tax=uncultured Parabacteroides sp. TaxID=512312 RepID=UPI00261E37FA|nr:S4 domain-containing protein [uncultured Parabacteroides sp.]
MEVRLNKLISDSGLCSRREADKFIEEGRVTVNGSLPHVGQKVTEADIVMLDDIQVKVGKHTSEHASVARGKAQELVFGEQKNKTKKEKPQVATTSEKKAASPTTGSKGLRPGKYVKYNKYAAARHAARNGKSAKKETKATDIEKEMLKEALRPKFGKSLGRSAVAQRLASSPKSAALRKTSKNNPLNKAKRAAARNKPKGE